jgi:hypothetical protein
MTNRYYTNSFQAALGTLAKSASVTRQLELIETAFDLLQDAIDELEGIDGITSLSGFPASFAGHALEYLRVNAAESAIEFVPGGRLNVRSIGGTSYTVVAEDANTLLIFTSATAVNVTIDAGVLAQGDVVCMRQGAAGQVTVVAGGGVTVQSSDDLMSTRKQGAQIALVCDNDDGTQFGLIGERNAPSLGLALLDQANVFTRVQTVTPYRANISGAVSIDLSATAKSNNLHLTLTGNVSSFALTNPSDGAVYNIRFIQDGTGGRTFAGFPSAFKFAGGIAPTFSTAAGAVDFLSAEYGSTEGTYMASFLRGMS